jgi:hypothetical protein
MSTNPEDHPRWAEYWQASIEAGELANTAARIDWEANERFRDEVFIPAVIRRMRADGLSEDDIATAKRTAMDEPNEYWGELRAGRRPPSAM